MKKIVITLVLTLRVLLGWSQTATSTAQSWQEKFFKAPKVALPLLIQAAIAHSGEIEKSETGRLMATEDVKLKKKEILNGLALVSGYSYGTLPYFGTSLREINSINAFALDARAQYSVGLGLNLPVDVLLGRRGAVYKQELALKVANAERKIAEKSVREVVINLYQNLVLAKTELALYQDALQSAEVNKKIFDKRFREGQIQVDEQIAAIEFYNKALLAQEQAKNKYETGLLLLEDLVGKSIQNVMNGK